MTSARTSATTTTHSQHKQQLQQQPKDARATQVRGPPARFPRRRHTFPRARSCLRATSAYCGSGSRLEELSATRTVTLRFGDGPKKSLSFADQHGLRLEDLREFSPLDAPTEFCDLDLDGMEELSLRMRRRRSGSLDRWAADAVARQHLLSMAVVSCSLLGAALIGLRQASK